MLKHLTRNRRGSVGKSMDWQMRTIQLQALTFWFTFAKTKNNNSNALYQRISIFFRLDLLELCSYACNLV